MNTPAFAGSVASACLLLALTLPAPASAARPPLPPTMGAPAAPVATATCGNDLVEAYEECDGASDDACPGACSDLCACPATGAGDLEVHVVDVGQGDGILVVSPAGFAMLVDAGRDGEAASIIDYMASIGLSSLDYLLVSHMDADHVGGMDRILAAFPEVVVAFDNGSDPGTLEYAEYQAAVGTRQQTVATGDRIDMGDGVVVEAVHSQAGAAEENNNSNVVRITHGDNSVLIGGDCEGPCEGSYDPGPTRIYKVHHHGASDSSSADFLDALQPWSALVSVGASNRYGHPHVDTLDRLDAVGAGVWRTDLDGDLEVLIDEATYTINGAPVCETGQALACSGSEVGVCTAGARSCADGMWGECEGAVLPAVEDCGNDTDDDCDGLDDLSDPDCAGTSTAVLIHQVAYDTPGTDSVEEFVDLYNPTGADVALDGWTLADGSGTWRIPAGTTIAAGGFLTIARSGTGLEAWTGITPDVWGMRLALSNRGDRVVLFDDVGTEVDRVAWEGHAAGWTGSASTGDSLVRVDVDVDTDSPSDWTVLSPASPYGGSLPAVW